MADRPFNRELLAAALMGDALPMRFPWGNRYNPQTGKLDARELKGIGFYGPVGVGDDVASEYSMDSDLGQFPSIAKDMPQDLLVQALSAARFHQAVPPAAADFAEQSAANRIAQGRSPFFEQGRDPYPAWSPDQVWPSPYMPK